MLCAKLNKRILLSDAQSRVRISFATAKNKMAALSFISVKFIPREIAGSGFHIRFYGVFQAIIPFDI